MRLIVDYLLPKKAEHTKAIYEKQMEFKESLQYEVYSNAYILPYRIGCYGGVVSSEMEYVECSATPALENKMYSFETSFYEDCTVVYGGAYIGHFGHFLTDTNLRTWIIFEDIWKDVDYIIFTRATELEKLKANCREFWQLLGIYDKVRIIDKPMQFAKVIVPECGYWNGKYYSQPWIDMFSYVSEKVEEIGEEKGWNRYDKIFLSRKKFAKREYGHREIDGFWKKNRYKVFYPERYSLSKLIWVMNHAEIISAISGTLLHHLLFCGNNKKIYICERYYPINELQIDINKIKQVDVTYIDCNICIFPTYIGNTPAILCYDDRMDEFAKNNNLVRCKKLTACAGMYRRYLKKYAYEWAKNGNLNVEENYLEERIESYTYFKEHYNWIKMRPGSYCIDLIKKIILP